MSERMTAAQLHAIQGGKSGKGGNKYNAQRVTINGIDFDSKKEGNRYVDLLMLERAGEIRDLKLQVPIMLEGKAGPLQSRTGKQMRLTVDFSYIEVKTGLTIYEDAKGVPTRDYEVRRAVAAAQGKWVVEV